MAPAMPLELALALTRPALPPLRARHDLCRVELERHLRGCLGVGLVGQPRGLLLLSQLTPGPAEELGSALGRAQLLGQLIAARLAVELVLSLVCRPRRGEDLPGDPIELVVDLRARVAGDPRAVDRHHPCFTSPARSHSLNTS